MLSPGRRQCHSGSTTTASWAHIFIQRQWLNKDPKKNSDPWKTPEGTIAGSFSLCSLMFWNCQRFGKLVFSIEVWSVPSRLLDVWGRLLDDWQTDDFTLWIDVSFNFKAHFRIATCQQFKNTDVWLLSRYILPSSMQWVNHDQNWKMCPSQRNRRSQGTMIHQNLK